MYIMFDLFHFFVIFLFLYLIFCLIDFVCFGEREEMISKRKR